MDTTVVDHYADDKDDKIKAPLHRTSSRSSNTMESHDEISVSRRGQTAADAPTSEPFLTPSKLAKPFASRHQLHTLMIDNFLRWLFTAVVLGFIVVTLKLYERKGATSNLNDDWFNVIVTALSIILALNYFSALKELAKMLRWRVLADKGHTARQVDLILAGDSIAVLCKLVYLNSVAILRSRSIKKGRREKTTPTGADPPLKPAFVTILKILIWIVVNLAAQVAIASISLAYSYESANAPITVPSVPLGPSYVSDLSVIYPLTFQSTNTQRPRDDFDQQASAHALGDIGSIFNTYDVDSMDNAATKGSQGNSEQYYSVSPDGDDQTAWGYRFFNYDEESFFDYSYSVPTDRTILVTWDNCYQYPVLSGASGNESSTTISYLNGTTNSTLGVQGVGQNTTTFIYPHEDCRNNDPRCQRLWAFSQPDGTNNPYLYDCEITVGKVQNSDPELPWQNIADVQARFLAAAAGLSGVPDTSITFTQSKMATRYQFQRYIADSYWSLAGMSGTEAGTKMAEFSIAAIAAMAEINPKLLKDKQPHVVQAVKLTVHWHVIEVLLPMIALVHFIFFVVTVFLANPYVVRDDSNLATALLLRPLLNKIFTRPSGHGGRQQPSTNGTISKDGQEIEGSYLTGVEIAELIDEALPDKEIVYRHKPSHDRDLNTVDRQGGTFHLGLYYDGVRPRKMAEKRQSDGIYV